MTKKNPVKEFLNALNNYEENIEIEYSIPID